MSKRKYLAATWAAALLLTLAPDTHAAPAPYPLSINSRAESIPSLTVYRSSEQAYALTFVDGTNRSNIAGHTVWMSWSTNATAATVSTATCAVVSGTGGTASATFSSPSLNYAPGRYIYEVGVTSGGVTRVYRQGTLVVVGSPYSTGGEAAGWTTNHPWSLITGTPTTLEGYGITNGGGTGTGDLAATNSPTAGLMLYASDTDKTHLYFGAAPAGGDTNAAIDDATNRVAGVGYLLPPSTQGLATVTLVNTASNGAVVTGTNSAIQNILARGYLLPASTSALVNVTLLGITSNGAVNTATNGAIQDILGRGFSTNLYQTTSITNPPTDGDVIRARTGGGQTNYEHFAVSGWGYLTASATSSLVNVTEARALTFSGILTQTGLVYRYYANTTNYISEVYDATSKVVRCAVEGAVTTNYFIFN